MAAIRTRLTIRVVSLLILAGLASYAGYRAWARAQPDAIWGRAQEFLASGDAVAAKSTLERLLTKDPAHPRGHLALARLQLRMARQTQPAATYAKTAEADQHLQQAVSLAKSDRDAALPVMNECAAEGLWEQAGEVAELVLTREPQNAEALYALATRQAAARSYRKAWAYLERLSQLPSEPRVRTLALQADVAQAEPRQDALREVAEHTLRLAAQGPKSLGRQDRAALDRLLLLSVQVADNAALAMQRAKAALDWQDARVAERNEPPVPPLAAELAVLFGQRWPAGELATSESYSQLWRRLVQSGQLAAADPNSPPETCRGLASLALIGGDSELSLSLVEEGLETLGKRTEAPRQELSRLHLMAARARLTQRQLHSATKHIQALLGQPEYIGLGAVLAAHVALSEGRYEDARSHLQVAVQRIGMRPVVRGTLAAYHMTQGAWREAAEQLDALQQTLGAAGADAGDARSWVEVTLGSREVVRLHQIRARLMLGEEKLAGRHVETLRGTKWEPQALAMQAGCLWASGRRQEANEVLRPARQAFPEDLPLARLAMQFLLDEDRQAEAESLVRDLAERRPDEAGPQLLVVNWMLARGDAASALTELERLLKAFPEQTGLPMLRAQMLLATGQADEALAALQTVDERVSAQTDRALLAALAALQLGDFSGAHRHLQSRGVVERQQGGVEMLAASVALLAQDHEHAVEAFAAAMPFSGLRSRAAEAAAGTLTTLADQAGYAAAQAKLDDLLRRFPQEPALWSCRVDLLVRAGEWQQAVQALGQLQSLPGGRSSAGIARARLQAALDRPDAALEELGRMLEADPHNLDAQRLAASLHLQQGHLREALRYAEEGLQSQPEAADLVVIQAQAMRRLGQPPQAVQVLEAFQKSHPRQAATYLQLAAWQEEGGDPAAASLTLQGGWQQLPQEPDLLYQAIRLACLANPEAGQALAERSVGDSKSSDVLTRVAGALAAGGAIEAARQWADRALQQTEEQAKPSATLHAVRGDIAHQQATRQNNDPALLSETRDEYQRALDVDPTQGGVAFALASLLARNTESLPQAQRVAEAAMNRLPLDRAPLELFELLFNLYLQTGQLSPADALLSKALTIRPTQENWLVAKAELGYRLGRCQETLAELARLEERAGPTAALAYARARLHEQLEQRQAAIAAAEQARKLLPAHVPARLLLARQYLALKRYDLADQHVRDALQLEPSAWDAHVLRAEIYQAAGRPELCRQAVEETQRLLGASQEREPARPELYQTAARLYQLAGASDAAMQVLDRGRRQVPGSAALFAQQVEILLAQGELARAERLASEESPPEPPAELCFLLGRAFQRHHVLCAAELWARRGWQLADPSRQVAAQLLLADVAQDQGKKTGEREYFELAREQYAAILAECPRHVVAGNNLAWLLATNLADPDGALTVAEQVRGPASLDTLHPDFLGTLLRVYRQTRRWAKAQAVLDAAARAAPDRPSLQLELGLYHAATNNPAIARDVLRQALHSGLDAEQRREAQHWISTL